MGIWVSAVRQWSIAGRCCIVRRRVCSYYIAAAICDRNRTCATIKNHIQQPERANSANRVPPNIFNEIKSSLISAWQVRQIVGRSLCNHFSPLQKVSHGFINRPRRKRRLLNIIATSVFPQQPLNSICSLNNNHLAYFSYRIVSYVM